MGKPRIQISASGRVQEDEDYTFLSQGVELQGIAKFEGVIRIDGTFNGAIFTNDTLIIGEHAVIRGLVTADEIICSGKLEAKLTAKKRIRLLKPAVVLGDISTPSFSMEDGVIFKGMCDMGVNHKFEMSTEEPQLEGKVQDFVEYCEKVPTY